MSIPTIKVKKLRDNAIIPKFQTDGAAGFDFHAAIDSQVIIDTHQSRIIPFGIAMEIPKGYVLIIHSRSGLAFKRDIFAYHGVIDSDFRGELSVRLFNEGTEGTFKINPGDRVAQGILLRYETVVFSEAEELEETERGSNGFGSTGV